MKLRNQLMIGLTAAALGLQVQANERLFTYTYEPETLPATAMEFEQWVTLRAGRNAAVGKEHFTRWDIREEFEYGVTDNYTVALYLNGKQQNYREPATASDVSKFSFEGVSIEQIYQVLNAAEKPIGLSLYLEGTYSGEEAEIEQKIILGQRHGQWKWALNLIHATEWEEHLEEVNGELEVSLGISRRLGKRWAVGIEARDHNNLPEYQRWANTAVFVGPVVSYHREKWWAALSIMPQVFGANYGGNPDNNTALDLKEHERLNVRLILGINL